jgi:hypothetical protein
MVEVDAERFAVRRSLDGGTDYEWLTGPDQGWATSDSPDRPHDAHVADLRESLRDLAARVGEQHLPPVAGTGHDRDDGQDEPDGGEGQWHRW